MRRLGITPKGEKELRKRVNYSSVLQKRLKPLR
jgi:hypothetical protein